jgi:hypothetical protein
MAYGLKPFGIKTVIIERGVITTNFQNVIAKKAAFDDNTNSK